MAAVKPLLRHPACPVFLHQFISQGVTMTILRASIVPAVVLGALVLAPAAHAFTPSIVLYANRGLVDSDGDGVSDVTDNAPGTFDPSQVDADADQIGDIID